MNQSASFERLARVAGALAWMQRLFLGWIVGGFFIGLVASTAGAPPELMLIPLLFFAVSFVAMLAFTYRCASGSGRSGLGWLLAVLVFKVIPLIILCYLTRKWLIARGVKVHSLGLGYTLPEEEPLSNDDVGFSRF